MFVQQSVCATQIRDRTQSQIERSGQSNAAVCYSISKSCFFFMLLQGGAGTVEDLILTRTFDEGIPIEEA